MNRLPNDLWRGIRRHPWRTPRDAFLAFSALWTVTEGLSYFVPGFDIKGVFSLCAIIAVSVIFALYRVAKPTRIEIKVPHTDTVLEILFGDLFAQEGYRAIAVNEFFDSELGKVVAEESLHGLFLKRCFGGHPESFDKQVGEELKGTPSQRVDRPSGKPLRYEIGTCALLTVDVDRYVTFAFTETDVMTCKASADVNMLWRSLDGLWKKARIETGGKSLNVPLVGSGLAGIGLPTRDLLNLIILSVIVGTKQQQITLRIRIVLWKDRYDDLDLREVKRYWEEH